MPAATHPAAHLSATLLLCLPLALPGLALAAEPAIEEIIVTAQKRAQSIEDVPIAISAFTAETLQIAGVEDIRDLTILSPSLILTSTQSETAGTTARIRGVGTTGDNLGLESSVAVFVDGVYRNRNNVALTDLGQVERIEVLRGPQGTLFGKNAVAGLLSITTQGPDTEELRAYTDLSAGDYDYWRMSAGITGPVAGDKLALRLDGSITQRDGFIDEVSTGTEYNDRDGYLLRGQLSSQLTDNLDLRVIADISNRDESCCAAVAYKTGPTSALIGLLGGTVINPARPYDRKMYANTDRGYDQETDEWGVSAELNWDMGDSMTLTSITAYRDWDADRSQDIDFTDADILYRDPGTYGNQFETLTQELRLAGTSGPLDWLVGLYYMDEQLDVNDAVRTGPAYEAFANGLLQAGGAPANSLSLFTGLAPGTVFTDGDGAVSDAFRQDTDGWAIFTHNIWNLDETSRITLGLRYTSEDKDVNAAIASDNVACPLILANNNPLLAPIKPSALSLGCLPLISPLVDGSYSGSREDDEVTGTLGYAHDFSFGWLGYASYGRGFKAGGFNLDRGGLTAGAPATSQLEFDPETVDAWEIGTKGMLLDAVQLNIALFWSEFDDFQLNSFNGLNFVVDNIGGVTSKGVEIEAQARPLEQLTLAGGVVYADTRYDDDVLYDGTAGNPDLRDKRLTNAPLWSTTGSATWEQAVGNDLMGFLHLDFRFNSDMNTGSNLDPNKEQRSYMVWNGRIGFGPDDKRWQLELWGRNLFDREYLQVAIDGPLQGSGSGATSTRTYLGFLGDPRTWGATFRYNF
ncbi:MAG: iron complex outerrane recepter protein [Pseudomonadota bacterium]|nr:iron complex outerrane recepter protein [Pseudomonadota bacterium]